MNRAKTHGNAEQFYTAVEDLRQHSYYPIWVSKDGLTIVELLYVESYGEYVWLEKHITKGKSLNSAGYQMVYLRCIHGVTLVHKLVANAWIGFEFMELDHINGDKTDNRAENLRYVSHSENMKAAYRNNLISNPTFKGRYNIHTSTFITPGHGKIKMLPEEYVAYRISKKLPVRGWMKEYETRAMGLLGYYRE